MAKNTEKTQNTEEVKVEKAAEKTVEKATVTPIKGMIFSRLDYAVEVKYKGEPLMVTPRAKTLLKDYNKLDLTSLPKGVTARKIG